MDNSRPLRLSQLDTSALDSAFVDKLLFEGLEYGGERADIIMVLGSRKACEYRVPPAAKLLEQGAADKLLFCGGRVQRTKFGEMAEYRSMLAAAQQLDLPMEAICTEERSMNTAENFKFSREILARQIPRGGSVILVTTAYHMRRAIMLARRILPEYRFIPATADCGSTRRSNWQLTEKGIRTAHAEAEKLAEYARKGYIENIEI